MTTTDRYTTMRAYLGSPETRAVIAHVLKMEVPPEAEDGAAYPSPEIAGIAPEWIKEIGEQHFSKLTISCDQTGFILSLFVRVVDGGAVIATDYGQELVDMRCFMGSPSWFPASAEPSVRLGKSGVCWAELRRDGVMIAYLDTAVSKGFQKLPPAEQAVDAVVAMFLGKVRCDEMMCERREIDR